MSTRGHHGRRGAVRARDYSNYRISFLFLRINGEVKDITTMLACFASSAFVCMLRSLGHVESQHAQSVEEHAQSHEFSSGDRHQPKLVDFVLDCF
jgi:hypothetical protein